jgi:hypothetical protein
MQWLVIKIFKRDMQRPSAAQAWQIPKDRAFPIPPDLLFFRSLPLEEQLTSYLAESANI